MQAAGQTLLLGVCFGVTLMCCFCNALPAGTCCFLLLAYLSVIYNLYMFLDTSDLEKRNQVFPGSSTGITICVPQVLIVFCDILIFSLSEMGNLASQNEPHRAPSLCFNVSLLLRSYILKVQKNISKDCIQKTTMFYIRICNSLIHIHLAGNSFHFLNFRLDTEQLRSLDLL